MKKIIVNYETRKASFFDNKEERWVELNIKLNPKWNKFATEVEINKQAGDCKIVWQYNYFLTLKEFVNHFEFNPQKKINSSIPDNSVFEIKPDCVLIWVSKYDSRSLSFYNNKKQIGFFKLAPKHR